MRLRGRVLRHPPAVRGPAVEQPPPLYAALGGPWTIRNIGPLVDGVTLFANAPALRAGTRDFAALQQTTRDDFRRLHDLAREAAPDARIGVDLFAAAGDHPGVGVLRDAFGDGFCRGLAGEAAEVADTLLGFAAEGFDRIGVLPPLEGTVELLAPRLLHA